MLHISGSIVVKVLAIDQKVMSPKSHCYRVTTPGPLSKALKVQLFK